MISGDVFLRIELIHTSELSTQRLPFLLIGELSHRNLRMRSSFTLTSEISEQISAISGSPSDTFLRPRRTIGSGSTAIGCGIATPELDLDAPAVSLVPGQGGTGPATGSITSDQDEAMFKMSVGMGVMNCADNTDNKNLAIMTVKGIGAA